MNQALLSLLCILAWLACGVVAHGLRTAVAKRHWSSCDTLSDRLAWALILVPLGPIGILAVAGTNTALGVWSGFSLFALLLLCSPAYAILPAPCEPVRDRVDAIENKTTPLFPQRGLTKCSVKENEMADEIVRAETEQWKDIPGFEGMYQVSDAGRVRSLDRVMPHKKSGTQTFRGRILTPMWTNRAAGAGYQFVNLQKSGKFCYRTIHSLVAEVFIGPCPEGQEINHKDGVKANPVVTNLEYVTHSENCIHARDTGLRKPAIGSRAGGAKLTEDKVAAILRLLGIVANSEIAKQFQVSHSTVWLIAKGKIWKHVSRDGSGVAA